jgi:hypothetical protein
MKDQSRVKDLAALLPLAGLFLFTPPVLLLFRPTVTVFALPLLPAYLFTTWLVLILASRQLTKYLADEPEQPGATTTDESSPLPPPPTDSRS